MRAISQRMARPQDMSASDDFCDVPELPARSRSAAPGGSSHCIVARRLCSGSSVWPGERRVGSDATSIPRLRVNPLVHCRRIFGPGFPYSFSNHNQHNPVANKAP
jgi:hypothetical protein